MENMVSEELKFTPVSFRNRLFALAAAQDVKVNYDDQAPPRPGDEAIPDTSEPLKPFGDTTVATKAIGQGALREAVLQ